MKYIKYIFIIGLLLLFFKTDCYAMTFEDFLTFVGSQEKSTQIENWYNFINNAYYNSTIDFTPWLEAWDYNADVIKIYNTSIKQGLAVEPQITFINLADNNLEMYFNNTGNIKLTGSLTYTQRTFKLNTNSGTTSVGTLNTYTKNNINVQNIFDNNYTGILIHEKTLYSDNSLTTPYTGFYYFSKNYKLEELVKFEPNTNNTYFYSVSTTMLGRIDIPASINFEKSKCRIVLNKQNDNGEYQYQVANSDNYITYNDINYIVDIPTRLLQDGKYELIFIYGQQEWQVYEYNFRQSPFESGEINYNDLIPSNNIINNNNNNTDKIIGELTTPYNPSGDFNITSGDIIGNINLENKYNSFFSQLINLIKNYLLTSSVRQVDLGDLPILDNHVIVDLDNNLKCPYPLALKIFIGSISNGAIIFIVFKYVFKMFENLTTGNSDKVLNDLENSSTSIINNF